jgi:hypothetical protein
METHSHRVARIEQALRTYFSNEVSVPDAEDPVEFRARMLLDDADDEWTGLATAGRVLVGLSDAPYVTQLAVILTEWLQTGTNPLRSMTATADTADSIAGVTPEFSS